ncbi:putative cytochrome P450 [Annulohypoxylon maeteangense]|uniref:putative cytochrome P450 n=1 Tax=Annulohypoxylon maeteangense TaxID=1927788 RepID=UPI00200879F4|nr:putative cytochrome P450 [Annulohypoxylon maeteangense]KAI0886387.1 putative cytochrome P450 [Annulohypoxylon maeteangense]
MELNYTVDMTVIVLIIFVSTVAFTLALRITNDREPPYLKEHIPFISNSYEYLTDMSGFMERAIEALSESSIIRFMLGMNKVYWVIGPKNTQVLFGPPHIVDPNMLHLRLMSAHWGMSTEEIKMFADDRSGKKKFPLPGTEHTPLRRRHWYNHHTLYTRYLSNPRYTEVLANTFYHFFLRRLDNQSNIEWTSIQLFQFLKNDMFESAIESLFGSQILHLNPDLIKCYWEFDEVAGVLVWGLPRFMSRRPYKVRERLHRMALRHLESSWENFDWNGPERESDWEPHFGSRFSRETAKWFKEAGFSNRTASGHTTATMFGLNGNTLPLTAWALMEIIQDPKLFRETRNEVSQSFVIDEETNKLHIDIRKLLSLPLLSSIYIEVLRMHVSFNATRMAQQDIHMGGYHISKGSIIQSPSQIAHYDEDSWGVDGHPASQFWASRHLNYTEKVDKAGTIKQEPYFSIKARPTSFFPYGGGHAMCPGRHFAKREIMMAIAMILTKFDIEFVEWSEFNGSTSHRSARNDTRYAGTAAMPPDRDMKIRWKRLW